MEFANKLRQNLMRLTLFTVLLMIIVPVLAACGGDISDTGSGFVPTATTAANDTSTQDAVPTSMPEIAMAEPTTAPTVPADISSQDPTPPADTSEVTPTPGASSDSGATTDVQATLREWAIDLSQNEAPSGKVRFTVSNSGTMQHNFTILDSNGTIANTPNFGPSDGPQTLEVDLQPGTYTIICSLPGHAARGQKTQLVVK